MQNFVHKLVQVLMALVWRVMFPVNFKMDIRFESVIGYDEQKKELAKAISKIQKGEKYRPKGIFIGGPEGTGKTLMAKAFIGEAQMPYMIISGGEIKKSADIKRVFSVARLEKSCIIFIDEFDAMSKNNNEEKIMAQFNFEMSQTDNVVVIATTRRRITKCGRFDVKIEMKFPNFLERKLIIENWNYQNRMLTEGGIEDIAKKCIGKSFMAIVRILNGAKENVIQYHNEWNTITNYDFIRAIMKEEKGGIVKKDNSPEDLKVTAFHEAGHALMAFASEKERIREITILNFEDSLGHISTYPIFENIKISKEGMECKIKIALAGKAAEEVFFGTSSNGARGDLIEATKLVREYLIEYCYDTELGIVPISNLNPSLVSGTEVNNQVLNRTRELLNYFYDETQKSIIEHQDLIAEIAEKLLEQKIIDESEAYEIYNKYQAK